MAVIYPPGYFTFDDDDNEATSEWMRFGMRLAIRTTFYPFEYAKLLMQLGYEPIAPVSVTSFSGRPVRLLPNVFQYCAHIRRVDGFFGCYRGLKPTLIGSVISLLLSEKIAHCADLIKPKSNDLYKTQDEILYIQFKFELKRDLLLSLSSIVIYQPFHVISARMMSQFIDRENIYNSVIGSIVEIYKNEGLKGFFSGLIPKLWCDVACVILTSTTVYILNKYIIKGKIGRKYNAGFMHFVFASILYPFQVVSSCMAVTGSRLNRTRHKVVPDYNSWIDCWNDLEMRGELKRGSSLFWRAATPEPEYKAQIPVSLLKLLS